MHRRALIKGTVTSAAIALASPARSAPIPNDDHVYRRLISDGMVRHRLTGASAALVRDGAVKVFVTEPIGTIVSGRMATAFSRSA
jgi:hypothetical protein